MLSLLVPPFPCRRRACSLGGVSGHPGVSPDRLFLAGLSDGALAPERFSAERSAGLRLDHISGSGSADLVHGSRYTSNYGTRRISPFTIAARVT